MLQRLFAPALSATTVMRLTETLIGWLVLIGRFAGHLIGQLVGWLGLVDWLVCRFRLLVA